MSRGKILIVEDEIIVAIEIKRALKKHGFDEIEQAFSYKQALEKIKQSKPNLIVMDINLKEEKDGIDLVKEIKQTDNIPVLYLTGFSDEKTMERAFDTDPVGYITKPFNRNELNITIKLALYKMNKLNLSSINKNHIPLNFSYYFDAIDEKLYYKNKHIRLGPKEKKLIVLLINAKFSYISSESIEYKLWPDNPPSESSLRTLIYRLKAKVGCKLIEISYSYGYKLTKGEYIR